MAKKLTIEEVKFKLKQITNDVIILDDTYNGNKVKMNCKCLVCDCVWKMNWNNLSNKHGCPQCYEKSRYKTDESIIEEITKNNYTFIEFISRGTVNRTKIKIACPENHIYEVYFKTFQNDRRCKKCGYVESAKKRLNNIETITNVIKSCGFFVVNPEDYTGKASLLQFMCKSNHTFTTSYELLRQTKICPLCEYNRESYRYSFEYVKNYFKEHGCVLLETEYISNRTKMNYQCKCGNKSTITFHDFIDGHRCYVCTGQTKWNIELIKEKFDEKNLTLLSTEYIPGVKLKYICKRGHEAEILINDFINGKNCFQCRNIEMTGENSWNWNPNKTIEERINGRKYKEYKDWRIAVYERDNYICQCCGDNSGGNLNAHHLDGHDWAIDKRLDVDNGITLCVTCHTDFHNLYGYGDNTREQFKEYKEELFSDAM